MKIRNGFVSNSSSSSYIVTIHDSVENVRNLLMDELEYDYFSKPDMMLALGAKIDDVYQTLKENKGGMDVMIELWKEHLAHHKERLRLLQLIKDKDEQSLFEFGMQEHYLKMVSKEKAVIIEGNTSMHNNFSDMPDLLQAIVLTYVFDHKDIKVELERIDHSS